MASEPIHILGDFTDDAIPLIPLPEQPISSKGRPQPIVMLGEFVEDVRLFAGPERTAWKKLSTQELLNLVTSDTAITADGLAFLVHLATERIRFNQSPNPAKELLLAASARLCNLA